MLKRLGIAKRALLVSRQRNLSLLRAAPASKALEAEKFQPGDAIHGFTVEDVSRVEEMSLDAIRLKHSSTGAGYLHLQRDDGNNVFAVEFRTIPRDSTGLAHVLEHTVTCGSERYPCREIFFKMYRRSLSTYMNAATGHDFTVYPAATQNPQDYRNLQSVYLDMVFKPTLRELDFRQEGWRLEHTDPKDKTSPIIFKGVVFNEMKGCFNENQVILYEKLRQSLLPSHTYANCSGGDPLVIPEMTHKALLDFHSQHYHPSNAKFYSYGNFPLEDQLKFIDEEYLQSYNRTDASLTIVPPEKRWEEPRRVHVHCKPDPMAADRSKQSTFAVSYLCNDIKDYHKSFELSILTQLLVQEPISALYKSLVVSQLGSGFGPLTGFETSTRDTFLAVSLQSVSSDDFDKIEKVYNDTLREVAEGSFPKEEIEAVLHNVELGLKHQTANFGINLLYNIVCLWGHDGDVVGAMRINEAMAKLRQELDKDPRYLNKLVRTYLIENNHRLTLTMSPDEKYNSQRAEAEQKLLRSKIDGLSEEDKKKTYEDGLELLADRQKQEPEVLPTLKVEDLKKDVDRYETEDLMVSGVPLQLSIQPTNGVTYFRGILSTRGLEEDLKPLLPLFNTVITKMGTSKNDYDSFHKLCMLKTGGLHFSSHVADTKGSTNRFEEGVGISSYCLDKNATDMWKLWEELFNEADLSDTQRFEVIVKQTAADLLDGIASSGHHHAMSSAKGLVSASSRLRETLSGLDFISRMMSIAQSKDLEQVLEQIRKIRERIFHKGHLRSALNLSPQNRSQIVSSMEEFYGNLKGQTGETGLITNGKAPEQGEEAVHHVMPYTVNYCSKAIRTVPFTNPEFAALRVMGTLVSQLFLLPEVREKDGAYGAGVTQSPDGALTFYSYRDPNSTKTLDTFDRTYDFLRGHSLSRKDIDEAKLVVFQTVDGPTPPDNRGMNKFLRGVTDDEVQEYRLRLKAVGKEEILEVAEKYLKPGQSGLRIGRALLGPKNEDLKKRGSEGWRVVDHGEQ